MLPPMRLLTLPVAILLVAAPAAAQSDWFQPSMLERPDVTKAMQSVDSRAAAIVDECSPPISTACFRRTRT